jgi:phospholipid/cholesterol/gamma-HCH transport system permease protein
MGIPAVQQRMCPIMGPRSRRDRRYSRGVATDTENLGETAKAHPVIGFVDAFFDPALELLDDIGATTLLFAQSVTWLVRPPFRIAQLFSSIEFIGAGSLFIAGLVGMFTGMAFTLSSIIGFRQFSAEGMVGGVVALALARELAPVLAAVVVTARAGSTMASELGNMRVTEQIDAITTMGVSPIQYLVVPRILATVIVLPLLALSFGIAGMFGAYLVGVVWQGIDPGVFLDRVEQFVKWADIRMLLVKSAMFGGIVSTICCKKGFYASGGARGVGEATAKAVVASIVAIFAADYVSTSIMTEL